jgi:hypothetical protein
MTIILRGTYFVQPGKWDNVVALIGEYRMICERLGIPHITFYRRVHSEDGSPTHILQAEWRFDTWQERVAWGEFVETNRDTLSFTLKLNQLLTERPHYENIELLHSADRPFKRTGTYHL